MKLLSGLVSLSFAGYVSAGGGGATKDPFECTVVEFDFDKDASGTALYGGLFADPNGNPVAFGGRPTAFGTITWPFSTTINTVAGSTSASAPHGVGQTGGNKRKPMLFNTQANPTTGEDPDLATFPLGMVLIISEDNNQNDPDDSRHGGTIRFTFGTPAKIKKIHFLDIEENGGEIIVYDCNGNEIFDASVPRGGNGQKSQRTIEEENICKMDVFLAGSGAITEIEFCSGDGGAMGDPHIMKWDGDYFDYHGECDLLLVDAPQFGNGAGLMMQIRTKMIEELGYSFVQGAAIKIGEDVLEIAGYGKYWLNGEAMDRVPAQIGGAFPMKYAEPEEYAHEYIISTDTELQLKISTLGEYLSLSVETMSSPVAQEWFGSSRGLMGSFGGVLLARDGKTIMTDTDEFGQEWQVQTGREPNLFQDKERAPQYPAKCIAPPAVTERRLRGVSRETAEEACAHVKNHKEACIFDVQATNNKGLAKHYF